MKNLKNILRNYSIGQLMSEYRKAKSQYPKRAILRELAGINSRRQNRNGENRAAYFGRA